jgi:predicted ribosomally synthesized peptide with nif11-like leader
METGIAFIQRMQEDAEFKQKVDACADGADRMAFLKSEGYDFTPFMEILDNLSSRQPASAGSRQPGQSTSHRLSAPNLWRRITQIFRPPLSPRSDR